MAQIDDLFSQRQKGAVGIHFATQRAACLVEQRSLPLSGFGNLSAGLRTRREMSSCDRDHEIHRQRDAVVRIADRQRVVGNVKEVVPASKAEYRCGNGWAEAELEGADDNNRQVEQRFIAGIQIGPEYSQGCGRKNHPQNGTDIPKQPAKLTV